ncbi:MAG: FimV/HubP family polar landmark protein [Halioglobus sp.]
MARKFAAVVFSLGCLQASSVMALGLGELTLDSFLNEPLDARVDLLNTDDLHADEIKVRLATKDDFDKLGVDRAYFLTSIKFEITTDERGQAVLVMSSDDPVLEPYLDIIVEARWPSGRLLREYTVLVDPPVFDDSAPVISASERVAEVEGLPAPVKKTPDPAATKSSGTHVDVKKSGLAPGEMPDRDYNAAASPTPISGSRYMVHRDDTLWEIAMQGKPAGASVHQTMLDIQRLNPKAFIGGNINRVKAGYIIYLPASGDISSADLATALAEVSQQNEDWRQGRASQPSSGSGPSLRISAEVEESADSGSDATATDRQVGASAATMEEAAKDGLENAEQGERLAAMEQQLQTLQRIVTLKDDQIAALQNALAEAGGSADLEAVADTATADSAMADSEAEGDFGSAPDELEAVDAITEAEAGDEQAATVTAEMTEQEPVTAVAVAPQPEAPAEVTPPAAKPVPAEQSGGFMSYIMYILGAIILAVLGFVFMRRRGEDSEDTVTAAPAPDVFANVQLKDQKLEVETPAEPAAEVPEAVAELDLEDSMVTAEEEPSLPSRDNRGYGEHKHDEYASDVDSGDALAEADIYIAYGRYPQAIDLLNNAIVSEPGNPAYRLKLLEMHAEMGDRPAAMQQFSELQAIGEPSSLARAEAVLADLSAAAPIASSEPAVDAPDDLDAGTEALLDTDFSGLEIEELTAAGDEEDDLDLSADFADSDLALDTDHEDLVIAADSNGMSTKLDLARAYLDMGDDDGARQILEEVAAEGTDELKAEARELLERIG